MRLPPFNPQGAIIVGVISVSTTAVFVKLAEGAPASVIANYRLLFAVIFMLPIILLKYIHEFNKIRKKEWILSIVAGVFLALYFILWFESLNYTSVASSVVLVTLQPIFAFLGTYFFFKERFSQAAIISMFIALMGSIIIGWGDFQISNLTLLGDMLALLGALAITGYFLAGQKVRKKVSLMTYTFVVYGIGAITLIIYNLIFQHSFFNYSTDQWWIFIALAIIPTFFGHSLFNWALKWVSTATISIAILFEPIGASILAYFMLEERITSSQWLGGAIVILGLFLFVMGTRRKRDVTIAEKKGK